MVKALFDTNILVDYLNGAPQARDELGRYQDPAISILTWMEVLVGTSEQDAGQTRSFLDSFDVVEIDGRVAEIAVELRRSTRLKLPDAIIWASAMVQGRLLITRNTKDFPADDPGVREPYDLS